MEPYRSKSGKESGVIAYQADKDYITVKFVGGEVYKYSYSSAGAAVIEKMKQLAQKQKGLSTFIAQNKPAFETKL